MTQDTLVVRFFTLHNIINAMNRVQGVATYIQANKLLASRNFCKFV
ncbi:hypothetical protein FJSC11DRAFT_2880 [Fischerella thermalis JSC-11]|jgi:hypothetical protein|uniref:Uncharacterized protein n=1 Tax=Fischerella thermalis JSC-11 TaxID=741277 RepID=G6FVI3_9CYAN|nr:hypothetical protein FJSC11DRAFT_2880 [Fischerella thermalis JSC-11]